MKFGAALSIVATTAAIWALSGPACDSNKDMFAAEGVADQISAKTAQYRSNRLVGATDSAAVIIADDGIPRTNVQVIFLAGRMDDSARISEDTVLTDNNGAAAVLWTYGHKPGAYQLSVRVVENPVLSLSFTADVIAGPLSKVTVASTATIDMNASTLLAVMTTDRYNNPVDGVVSWRSLNPTIASVGTTGLVTGHAGGTARIIASAGTAEDTTVVTVRSVVTGIDIVAPAYTLNAGTTMQLAANVAGDPAAAVTWLSLNPTVATVDNAGKLSALTAGQARMVASAGTRADTATFTVTAVPATTVNVSPGAQVSVKRLAAGTTESFQGLYVGDHEANGDKGIQGFVLYSLQNVPAGATVSSAKVTVLRSATGAAGDPLAFGTLFAERAATPELNEGTLSTSAIGVLAPTQQSATVDITPLIQQARAAGQTSIWLRLRFGAVQNNNGVIDYGAFMAGGLEIKY